MHIFWSKLKYSPPGIIEREVAGVTAVHSRPISRTLPPNSRSQLSLIDSYTSSSRLQTGGNVVLYYLVLGRLGRLIFVILTRIPLTVGRYYARQDDHLPPEQFVILQ